MAGAASMAMGSIMTSEHCPFVCVDALSLPKLNLNSGGCHKGTSNAHRRHQKSSRLLELNSSFVEAWQGRRPSGAWKQQQRKSRRLVVVDEVAGQYEEGFEDVHVQLTNYFTYKATRTVLHQLYEMNPPKYRWFYNFIATNKPTDGKRFLRSLGREKQDLAERVMITRLHLYGQWVKKCDHEKMYQKISDENLQIMRERLMETVIWPSDDTNTEKIG